MMGCFGVKKEKNIFAGTNLQNIIGTRYGKKEKT